MTLKKNYLKNITSYFEHLNKMTPFPLIDTEYVSKLKLELDTMVDDNHNYDEDPVYACKYCKNLNVQYDDDDNEICMRCGSKNATITFDNIFDYLKFKNSENE